jgi:WD40 repeat protein
MWTVDRFFWLRCGIVSVVIIMAAAIECLPVQKSGGQGTVSPKLIRTLSNSELASSEPFSKQGVLAVRAGDVVQLWDTQTLTLRASLPGHERILKAFFSAGGETFITSSREKSSGLITRLWDVQTGRLKHTLTGLVIYHPTDSGLGSIVTFANRELKFWNAETGELKKTVPAYKGTFSDSEISFDGRVVVRYGGKKGFLWETGTGRLIAELTPPEKRDVIIPYYTDLKLEGAWFSPDSKVVATTDSLNSIELWDAGTGRLRALLEGHGSTIYSLTFSPDGRLLASASRDGSARLWNVETGRLVATLKAGKEIARRVAFNPAGTLLAVGYQTQARVWDVSSAQLLATLSPHSDINKTVLFGTYLDAIEILFSPDGRLLLTVGDKSVKVWATTGELITTLGAVRSPVALAPGEKLLATTGPGGSVLLWAIQ